MSTPHKVTRFIEAEGEPRGLKVWSVIEDFRPASTVIALKFGGFLLAAPTIFTSLLVQQYFNRCYKIGRRNMFTFVPMVVPAIATGLLHRKTIEGEVLLETMSCQGCLEFKCASMHVVTGVLWSFPMAALSATMVGALKKSVYVPPIDKYPLQTLQLAGKHLYRYIPTAIALCLGNFAYTLVLTHLEVEQYKNMKNRMLTILNALDLEVTPMDFYDSSS